MKHLWSNGLGFLLCSLLVLSLHAPVIALMWQDVAEELMSPACPGRTLINCTSGQSEQWRELIRQKIAQGETKEQIIQYFVNIRGEEILAAPPKQGFALTAWLLPLFVIINGIGLIIALTYRWVRNRPGRHVDGLANDPSLTQDHSPADPYRARLRSELEEFRG
jgi:cytochrome c-type biogenesis protein CcmH